MNKKYLALFHEQVNAWKSSDYDTRILGQVLLIKLIHAYPSRIVVEGDVESFIEWVENANELDLAKEFNIHEIVEMVTPP